MSGGRDVGSTVGGLEHQFEAGGASRRNQESTGSLAPRRGGAPLASAAAGLLAAAARQAGPNSSLPLIGEIGGGLHRRRGG
jgi:hypothetical protein